MVKYNKRCVQNFNVQAIADFEPEDLNQMGEFHPKKELQKHRLVYSNC